MSSEFKCSLSWLFALANLLAFVYMLSLVMWGLRINICPWQAQIMKPFGLIFCFSLPQETDTFCKSPSWTILNGCLHRKCWTESRRCLWWSSPRWAINIYRWCSSGKVEERMSSSQGLLIIGVKKYLWIKGKLDPELHVCLALNTSAGYIV